MPNHYPLKSPSFSLDQNPTPKIEQTVKANFWMDILVSWKWRYMFACLKHPNVVSMLGQRQRRWPNIETALGEWSEFAWIRIKRGGGGSGGKSRCPYDVFGGFLHIIWQYATAGDLLCILSAHPLPGCHSNIFSWRPVEWWAWESGELDQ